MKRICILALLALCTSTAFAQTRFKSLNYLYRISGKQTASGIHNREPNAEPARWTNEVYAQTGKYPALWSGDFLFQADNINNRRLMIEQAKTQWKKGALINIMWHACNPALAQPCGWDSTGVLSKLTDAQWQELITDGTALNRNWKSRMDEVAVYLRDLKNNGVEVLFRPLHEMNQGAFWWGGRPGPQGTARLYQITRDYLEKEKGLDNLIWVWNVQDFKTLSSDLAAYNPGKDYWDVLSLDVYWSDGNGYTTEKYQAIEKAAEGKPFAIGECEVLPSVAELAAQPKWAFFMSWSELTFEKPTALPAVKTIYQSPRVVTLEAMPGWEKATDSMKGKKKGKAAAVPRVSKTSQSSR
jgi:mannan endo-1,4-beta-mannosidase